MLVLGFFVPVCLCMRVQWYARRNPYLSVKSFGKAAQSVVHRALEKKLGKRVQKWIAIVWIVCSIKFLFYVPE